MLQPYFEIDDEENSINSPFLSVGNNGLSLLSWTQKSEYRLEIWCSVFLNVCVRVHFLESGEVTYSCSN